MSLDQEELTTDLSFKQHFNQVHKPTARYVGIATIVVLVLFAWWDVQSLGFNHPEITTILLIRFGLTIPIILITIASTLSKKSCLPQDILVTLTCIITSLTIIALHWKFSLMGRELELDSIMLCLVAVYFLPNIFSHHKFFIGITILTFYYLFLYITRHEIHYYIHSGIYLISINIAGLIHSVYFDNQRRIIFEKTEFLKRLALTDQLTGADNRHRFDADFSHLLKTGKDEAKGIGIAIVDIDFFKQFNDAYGHLIGDECLIKVAQAFLSMKSHPLDKCIRFGGEEFILIKYGLDHGDLETWGQSIIDTIYQLDIEHSASSINKKVTVSAGVIYWSPNSTLTRTDLMAQADEALYQAKNNGRNQVQYCKTE